MHSGCEQIFMRKKWKLIALVFLAAAFFSESIRAQEMPGLDYGQGPVVDMDLDGLTDAGEKELYLTDPVNADTDGDGVFDGVEVIQGSNPLDASSRLGAGESEAAQMNAQQDFPLPWYISRMSGLVSFALLYVSVLLGLSIRLPFLGKILAPAYSFKVHCWISLQALFFAFIHGVALLFDEYLGFSVRDVFVPFISSFEPFWLGLGTVAFYLMIALVATSYLKRFVSHRIWRWVHYLGSLLYVFGAAHALALGTDLKEPLARGTFISFNILLVLLILANIGYRAFSAVRRSRSGNEQGAEL